uniref:Protein-tyrosine-phosphatase n=1 Tax=Caenorhabditis japonica TaxID=281687 RepID=A0A8R1HWQ3_CAEJA
MDEYEKDMPRAEAGGGSVFDLFQNKKGKKSATARHKGEKSKNKATEMSKREEDPKKKKKKAAAAEKTVDKDEGENTRMVTTTVQNLASSAAPAPGAASAGHPIVESWCQRALDFGVEKLRDEFRQLAKYTKPDMTQNAFNANCSPTMTETKNRYQDVPCQDQHIVKLEKPPAPNDYIHANFVGTPANPEKRFICTQGPLDQTVEDFWWMIVQQKVERIIMLCKTIECGKFKCAQYWPEKAGEKKQCGPISIENASGPTPMDGDGEIQVTMLNVVYNGTTYAVRHLHWTDWPDRGVPPCKLTSLDLLSTVRGTKTPIVVHCSAGIGRTGTIVAIEYILEKISYAASKEFPPMPDLVKALRDMRAFSIQNDLQYLYIHRVMLNYFLEKYKDKYSAILTPDNVSKYEKFIKDYNTAVGQ